MEDYPKTILEFETRFASEEACRDYLFALRWPEGFQCPACDRGKAWWTSRYLLHCAACGHQASVIAGTVFQDTHKPLRLWFRALWYVTSQKSGVSALGLQRVLGLGSYHTAWAWLHKLRRAMVRPGRDRLSGVVEVDEVYIGARKSGPPGRGAAGKRLVVIAAEKDGARTGRIRLRQVSDASSKSLHGAITEAVESGSTIQTDGWDGYRGLGELGYLHKAIRGTDEVGEHPLPHCHRVASLLQRWLLGTHQGAVRPSHLDYYLDEFTFRFNRRTSRSRGKLFYRLAQQAVAIDPVPESELRGGKPDASAPTAST
jgi:transposase-like protein